jgi:hypothetical protein
MKTLTIDEAERMNGKQLLAMASPDDALVLTENGEGRFVLGAVDDLSWEAFLLSKNPEFMAYLDDCRARADREGCISLEEAKKRLGIE